MDKDLKSKCKAMLRSALDDLKYYHKYHIATTSEKSLIINGMMSVIDYMPLRHEHQRSDVRDYIESMYWRLASGIRRES